MVNKKCTHHEGSIVKLFMETFSCSVRHMTTVDTEDEKPSTLDVVITSVDYTDYKDLLPHKVIITSVNYNQQLLSCRFMLSLQLLV